MQQYSVICQTGLTADSVHYIAAARSLAATGKLLQADGSVYTHWPPLFPAFLSLFGPRVLGWIGGINCFLLVGTVTIFSRLALALLPDLFFQMLYMLALVVNTPLLLIHAFVWSEPLFLLLLSLHYLFLSFYLKTFSVRSLLGMAFCSLLFCLQRNTGVFFVIGTAAVVLGCTPRERYKCIVYGSVYTFAALSGWLGWSLRNARILGTDRFHSITGEYLQGFTQNLILFLNSGTAWFLPLSLPLWLRALITLAAAVLLLWRLVKTKKTAAVSPLVTSLAAITGSYLLWLAMMQVTDFSEVERYLAVVYPAVLLMLFSLLHVLYTRTLLTGKRRMLLLALLIMSLIYPCMRTLNNVQLWHRVRCVGQG